MRKCNEDNGFTSLIGQTTYVYRSSIKTDLYTCKQSEN